MDFDICLLGCNWKMVIYMIYILRICLNARNSIKTSIRKFVCSISLVKCMARNSTTSETLFGICPIGKQISRTLSEHYWRAHKGSFPELAPAWNHALEKINVITALSFIISLSTSIYSMHVYLKDAQVNNGEQSLWHLC